MISKLVYVCCDRCGVPADDGTLDGAREARAVARHRGFTRKPNAGAAGPRMLDLCPECTKAEA